MPHQRKRHLEQQIRKLSKFWPIIGVLGLRQVGKSTLLRDRLHIENYLTLDDDDTRVEAETSSKTFIARNELHPTVIDEVQKVPKLFDAIKSHVDKKKRPGQWYLSGSVSFSNKIGIRESLTGRIGIMHLYPMTLSELRSYDLKIIEKRDFILWNSIRFKTEDIAQQMQLGGLPVPAFIRDEEMRIQYWKSWVDTTLLRDTQKAYGRNFNPDICMSIVRMLSRALLDGEYPSLDYVKKDKRIAKKYIQALESIFFLRRISIHEYGTGKDYWIFGDSGLAYYLSNQTRGSNITLSLARHFILNEIFSLYEYNGQNLPHLYFKSQRGSIIDLVLGNMPIKIINETVSPTKIGWHERPILGAMKKLNSPIGLIVAPVDYIHLPPKNKGIGIVPWSFWS